MHLTIRLRVLVGYREDVDYNYTMLVRGLLFLVCFLSMGFHVQDFSPGLSTTPNIDPTPTPFFPKISELQDPKPPKPELQTASEKNAMHP